MTAHFAAPHLDPSQDGPELSRSTLAFLCDLWDQVGHFKSGCRSDESVLALLTHLENQLTALGVVLVTNIRVARPEGPERHGFAARYPRCKPDSN